MTSRKELIIAFDKMESERQELLKRLEQFSEEVLTKKPSPTSWSVTETIYHLKEAVQHKGLSWLTQSKQAP